MIDFYKHFLIAGPCVIESYEHLFKVAAALKKATDKYKIPWILKASYDKANRTSIESFRGPGVVEGISILNRVKRELGCPITTDFHTQEDLFYHGTTVDIIQIPAFLCRQSDLLAAAARTQKPVNVKKGQFIHPWDVMQIRNKLRTNRCVKPLITERGTQFGSKDVVVDFRFLGESDILDVTHTVTDWSASFTLAKAGLAAGIKGIFCEVGSERCDSARSIPLNRVEDFVKCLAERK